jgi:hypothetical protein
MKINKLIIYTARATVALTFASYVIQKVRYNNKTISPETEAFIKQSEARRRNIEKHLDEASKEPASTPPELK